MLEALPGVDIRYHEGKFAENYVIEGVVQFYFDNPEDTGTLKLGSTEFVVSPKDYPFFMELKTNYPPYIIEGRVKGPVVNADPGNGSLKAVLWVVSDWEAVRKQLIHELGSDTLADLLGAVNANLKNLTPVPAIIETRW